MKKGQWSVIFLLDKYSPTKIVMLKRSKEKKFAPNLYTGIGGKQEEVETPFEGAKRELFEETGLKNPLKQFAKVVVDGSYYLHYFWGVLEGELPNCTEGELEWVKIEDIFSKDIIPTTYGLLKEWKKRGFKTDKYWKMYFNSSKYDL